MRLLPATPTAAPAQPAAAPDRNLPTFLQVSYNPPGILPGQGARLIDLTLRDAADGSHVDRARLVSANEDMRPDHPAFWGRPRQATFELVRTSHPEVARAMEEFARAWKENRGRMFASGAQDAHAGWGQLGDGMANGLFKMLPGVGGRPDGDVAWYGSFKDPKLAFPGVQPIADAARRLGEIMRDAGLDDND